MVDRVQRHGLAAGKDLVAAVLVGHFVSVAVMHLLDDVPPPMLVLYAERDFALLRGIRMMHTLRWKS